MLTPPVRRYVRQNVGGCQRIRIFQSTSLSRSGIEQISTPTGIRPPSGESSDEENRSELAKAWEAQRPELLEPQEWLGALPLVLPQPQGVFRWELPLPGWRGQAFPPLVPLAFRRLEQSGRVLPRLREFRRAWQARWLLELQPLPQVWFPLAWRQWSERE